MEKDIIDRNSIMGEFFMFYESLEKKFPSVNFFEGENKFNLDINMSMDDIRMHLKKSANIIVDYKSIIECLSELEIACVATDIPLKNVFEFIVISKKKKQPELYGDNTKMDISLKILEILMEIEMAFNINLSDDEACSINTLEDLALVVLNKENKKTLGIVE